MSDLLMFAQMLPVLTVAAVKTKYET